MIKRYFTTFFKTFFFTSLPFILTAAYVYRRYDYQVRYAYLTLGVIIISAIIALSIRVFKAEKGNALLNSILGYLILTPILFIVRVMFNNILFRRILLIYIIIVIVGIIYGIALLVANRKYKGEVNELNRLLINKANQDPDSDEEED